METGINASTLRAWERRYGVPSPNRSDSGYRLYSQRDMAIIKWLKNQLENGITISQAVQMLDAMPGGQDSVPVEQEIETKPAESRRVREALSTASGEIRNLPVLQEWLYQAFRDYDEPKAERILAEAFSMFSADDVCLRLLESTLVVIGDGWQRGEVSVAVEHFASAFVRRHILALVNAQPVETAGPRIAIGAAPGELHEIGVLLIALFLRWHDFHVVFLGQLLPLEQVIHMARQIKPSVICISAATVESALTLTDMQAMLEPLPPPRPIFGFGGSAFNRHPELRTQIPGTFLGQNAREAVRKIQEITHWGQPFSSEIH
ncbi:MAG: MerR family transcriptional regulator [Chloroflexi bacterium]|nr:MerR family transcriptional regulator [Chloroflexota bacterium]